MKVLKEKFSLYSTLWAPVTRRYFWNTIYYYAVFNIIDKKYCLHCFLQTIYFRKCVSNKTFIIIHSYREEKNCQRNSECKWLSNGELQLKTEIHDKIRITGDFKTIFTILSSSESYKTPTQTIHQDGWTFVINILKLTLWVEMKSSKELKIM